jgi:hypothetical protein
MFKHFFFFVAVLFSASISQAQIDSTEFNPCDPIIVASIQSDLVLQGYDCLEGAGPFECLDEVFAYGEMFCNPVIVDTTEFNPCDPIIVASIQSDLVLQGYDCLEGAGPFECLDDVFAYAELNCDLVIIDTIEFNPCDQAYVASVQSDLILQGYDCLVDAGPFACVDDLYTYLQFNCFPVEDSLSNPCDPTVVASEQANLIANGFDCMVGAGPFECLDEMYNYLVENCEGAATDDSLNAELPLCFVNFPAEIVTFQQFIDYVADNCDAEILAGIPTCWFDAPDFETDEEFLAYVTENCDTDSLVSGGGGISAMMQAFMSQEGTSSSNEVNKNEISISPNPSNAILNISAATEINSIEILDMNGRFVVLESAVNANSAKLDISQLPNGLYIARVTTNFEVINKKVVKN